jgi:hypothetical protein
LFGPDGSHWNTNVATDADWKSFGFMLWRASISDRVDETYAKWRDAARAYDIPFCAYHFVWQTGPVPGTTSSGRSAAVQAAAFARAEPDRSIPVMLDFESTTEGGVLVSACTFDHVLEVAAALRGLGYRVPLLYSNFGYWDAQGQPVLAGHGFELVRARYGAGWDAVPQSIGFDRATRYAALAGDAGNGWEPLGGLTPVMWQFSDRVRWGGSADDMNAIRDPAVIARNFKDWTPPVIDTVPTSTVTVPTALRSVTNGQLPADWLRSLPGETREDFKMFVPVSYAMQAMHIAAMNEAKIDIMTTGRYRSAARQEALFRERYRVGDDDGCGSKTWNGVRWYLQRSVSGGCFAMAATPGTSNHGLGIADDIAEQRDSDLAAESLSDRLLGWLRDNAPAFGFRLETRKEPWHWHWSQANPNALSKRVVDTLNRAGVKIPDLSRWAFTGGGTEPPPPPLITAAPSPTMRIGVASPDIKWLQTILHQRFGVFPAIDGIFGPATEAAVKHMQDVLRAAGKNVGPSDGVYGPMTAAALASWLADH